MDKRLTKITFHGVLGEQLAQKEWNLEVRSVGEAMRAVQVLTKRKFFNILLENDRKGVMYEVIINGKVFEPEDQLGLDNLDDVRKSELCIRTNNIKTIDIVPVLICGSGKVLGIFALVLGVILIATGVGAPAGLAAIGLSSTAVIIGGIALVAAGVASLLAKPPKFKDNRQIDQGGGGVSYLFNGPENIVGEGGPVPLGYGRLIVGGQTIASSLKTTYFENPDTYEYGTDPTQPPPDPSFKTLHFIEVYSFNHIVNRTDNLVEGMQIGAKTLWNGTYFYSAFNWFQKGDFSWGLGEETFVVGKNVHFLLGESIANTSLKYHGLLRKSGPSPFIDCTVGKFSAFRTFYTDFNDGTITKFYINCGGVFGADLYLRGSSLFQVRGDAAQQLETKPTKQMYGGANDTVHRVEPFDSSNRSTNSRYYAFIGGVMTTWTDKVGVVACDNLILVDEEGTFVDNTGLPSITSGVTCIKWRRAYRDGGNYSINYGRWLVGTSTGYVYAIEGPSSTIDENLNVENPPPRTPITVPPTVPTRHSAAAQFTSTSFQRVGSGTVRDFYVHPQHPAGAEYEASADAVVVVGGLDSSSGFIQRWNYDGSWSDDGILSRIVFNGPVNAVVANRGAGQIFTDEKTDITYYYGAYYLIGDFTTVREAVGEEVYTVNGIVRIRYDGRIDRTFRKYVFENHEGDLRMNTMFWWAGDQPSYPDFNNPSQHVDYVLIGGAFTQSDPGETRNCITKLRPNRIDKYTYNPLP